MSECRQKNEINFAGYKANQRQSWTSSCPGTPQVLPLPAPRWRSLLCFHSRSLGENIINSISWAWPSFSAHLEPLQSLPLSSKGKDSSEWQLVAPLHIPGGHFTPLHPGVTSSVPAYTSLLSSTVFPFPPRPPGCTHLFHTRKLSLLRLKNKSIRLKPNFKCNLKINGMTCWYWVHLIFLL